MEIRIERSKNLKAKPDWNKPLGFGSVFTDHMFLMDYDEGQGWHDARIVPFGNLCYHPAACVFHYGVEIFEGMKAYKAEDGRVLLFRPDANARRMNRSAERLCIPTIPVEDFVQAVRQLVDIERDWVPDKKDMSLYIRPTIVATEPHLGVSCSKSYTFFIIVCPVGAYYPEGLNPVKIYVEDTMSRAAIGGTGFCKCGGNYAASLLAQVNAHAAGYSQVLWLDGAEHKYLDEVGTMNFMLKIDGEILTPSLDSGSILPGITRDSILTMLREWGYKATERLITLEEVKEAAENGKLEEAWGTGTAAVISPVGELNIHNKSYILSGGKIGELSQKLYDSLTDIQWGRVKDTHGWGVEI